MFHNLFTVRMLYATERRQHKVKVTQPNRKVRKDFHLNTHCMNEKLKFNKLKPRTLHQSACWWWANGKKTLEFTLGIEKRKIDKWSGKWTLNKHRSFISF